MSSIKGSATLALACVALILCASTAQSATITWIGIDPQGDWSEPDNWNPQQVPTINDDVVHDGSGVGIIVVDFPGAACRSFTATAGGSFARGLRIDDNMSLTIGQDAPDAGGMVVIDQTESVRYLTELRYGARLKLLNADGGDFLFGPQSEAEYNSSILHFRNGVWRIAGGYLDTTEGESTFGFAGETGKLIIEAGGAFHAPNATAILDQLEIRSGGHYWGGILRPLSAVQNLGGNLSPNVLIVDSTGSQAVEVLFSGGAEAHQVTGHPSASDLTLSIGVGHSLVYEGVGNDVNMDSLLFEDGEASGGGRHSSVGRRGHLAIAVPRRAGHRIAGRRVPAVERNGRDHRGGRGPHRGRMRPGAAGDPRGPLPRSRLHLLRGRALQPLGAASHRA